MNTSDIDLSEVPFVDNHAHALSRRQPETPEEFRQHFVEAHSPLLGDRFVGGAVHFRWAIRQLASHLEVDATENAILSVRGAVGEQAYVRRLAQDARISALLLDEGFPPAADAITRSEMQAATGVRVEPMLRIETSLERIILAAGRWQDLVDSFDRTLADALSSGYVALKSIAAYRTGLDIGPPDEKAAEGAFGPLLEVARREGGVRLEEKSIIDFFVWRAARFAALHAMPLQFHTGYGDPDLDLRLANPLHLRPLFEDSTIEGAPIVLLHASYPFTAEAAYLASVYPNAYMDIAFSLPPLGSRVLEWVLNTALGVAPSAKILFSSDGVGIAEHYWLGATRARQCLGAALVKLVSDGDISYGDAEKIAESCLNLNAMRCYKLNPT